jgi:hypothetical protein
MFCQFGLDEVGLADERYRDPVEARSLDCAGDQLARPMISTHDVKCNVHTFDVVSFLSPAWGALIRCQPRPFVGRHWRTGSHARFT